MIGIPIPPPGGWFYEREEEPVDMSVPTLRPEVAAFAVLLEERMRAGDAVPGRGEDGWKGMDWEECLDRAGEELVKVWTRTVERSSSGTGRFYVPEAEEFVRLIADAGNYLMMAVAQARRAETARSVDEEDDNGE